MSTQSALFDIPRTQRAVIVDDNGNIVVCNDAPIAAMGPNQFLVRTDAVAINPSDTKMLGDFATPMGILGSDYAGTVVALGSNVREVEIGQRVCGVQNPMKADTPERGSFAQYNVPPEGIWLKIPPFMSTEAGAAIPSGIGTASLAIMTLGLPLPDNPSEKPSSVLVWGGSTATGTIAIQLLRLANMIPIAVCSSKNGPLVKTYGADEVFDYRDTLCAVKIRNHTRNNLKYVIDCITTIQSTEGSFDAIGRVGGKYVSLDPFSSYVVKRKNIIADWVLGPSLFGEGSTWPAPYQRGPNEELKRLGVKLFRIIAQKLMDEGKLRNHPLRLLDGGIDKIIEGLNLVRSGNLSAEKVVVRYQE